MYFHFVQYTINCCLLDFIRTLYFHNYISSKVLRTYPVYLEVKRWHLLRFPFPTEANSAAHTTSGQLTSIIKKIIKPN